LYFWSENIPSGNPAANADNFRLALEIKMAELPGTKLYNYITVTVDFI
jgi:hypothetical protein